MSHLYGKISGRSRTGATRCGTKKSGIRAEVMGWRGRIVVEITHDPMTGNDKFLVLKTRHPRDHEASAESVVLASGILEVASKRNGSE